MTEQQALAGIARRDVLVGGICLAGAAGSAWMGTLNPAPHLPRGGLATLVPEQIGNWRVASVEGVIVAESIDDRRGNYDDLLTRIYRADDAPPVTLLVAYGSSQMDVWIHRPEACYPAAGFALSDQTSLTLPFGHSRIAANMIRARSLLRTEQLLYWTRIGAHFPTSGAAQRWAVFRENLAGRVPDGVLLRVSTPEPDRARALAALRKFLSALHAAMPPAGVHLLFG